MALDRALTLGVRREQIPSEECDTHGARKRESKTEKKNHNNTNRKNEKNQKEKKKKTERDERDERRKPSPHRCAWPKHPDVADRSSIRSASGGATQHRTPLSEGGRTPGRRPSTGDGGEDLRRQLRPPPLQSPTSWTLSRQARQPGRRGAARRPAIALGSAWEMYKYYHHCIWILHWTNCTGASTGWWPWAPPWAGEGLRRGLPPRRHGATPPSRQRRRPPPSGGRVVPDAAVRHPRIVLACAPGRRRTGTH